MDDDGLPMAINPLLVDRQRIAESFEHKMTRLREICAVVRMIPQFLFDWR